MKQTYHSNATKNVHIRCEIQNSNLPINQLAAKYNVSESALGKLKWENREDQCDRSSRPHTIYYSFSALEMEVIKSVRRSTWLPLGEIVEIARQLNLSASHSAVYRTLRSAGLNKVPQKERNKTKKFKAYEPGYLHIDVTYLPKLDGLSRYLFVAIDRATRTLFYWVYEAKTSDNAQKILCRNAKHFSLSR